MDELTEIERVTVTDWLDEAIEEGRLPDAWEGSERFVWQRVGLHSEVGVHLDTGRVSLVTDPQAAQSPADASTAYATWLIVRDTVRRALIHAQENAR